MARPRGRRPELAPTGERAQIVTLVFLGFALGAVCGVLYFVFTH
jgi:hypothetical protein